MKEGLEASFSTESSSWVLKISHRLNCSSLCGDPTASKSGSWQSLVVSVVEEKLGGVGGGFRGREGGRRWFFYAVGRIWNLQHSPGRVSLTWASWSSSNFSASVKKIISHTQDVISQIPTVIMWRIILGTSRKKLKTIQRLRNSGWRFYWNKFR